MIDSMESRKWWGQRGLRDIWLELIMGWRSHRRREHWKRSEFRREDKFSFGHVKFEVLWDLYMEMLDVIV